MDRVFNLSSPKPSFSEGFVDIGLAAWLGSETISDVAFMAEGFVSKRNETANVLNTDNCTWTETVIRPWIKGGSHGEKYLVKMNVTTNQTPATKESFYLIFEVNDNLAGQPNY